MDSTLKESIGDDEESIESSKLISKKRKHHDYDDEENESDNLNDETRRHDEDASGNETISKKPKIKTGNLDDGGEGAEIDEDALEGDEVVEEEEKENLEQSFDISSSDEDDDENNKNDNNSDDSLDKVDLFNEPNNKDLSQITENDESKLDTSFSDDTKKLETHLKGKGSKKSDEKSQNESPSKGSESKPSTSEAAHTSSASERRKKQTIADNLNREIARKKKLELLEEENKKMQVLMANFSEEQLNRYEVFRRSAFPKSSIKRIIQTVCGKSVSASVVIAMSGISKVFVGEMVEKALEVKEKWNDTGPLQPKHLREAFRVFKASNKLSNSSKSKKVSLF